MKVFLTPKENNFVLIIKISCKEEIKNKPTPQIQEEPLIVTVFTSLVGLLQTQSCLFTCSDPRRLTLMDHIRRYQQRPAGSGVEC
jgi:hypothetical protein